MTLINWEKLPKGEMIQSLSCLFFSVSCHSCRKTEMTPGFWEFMIRVLGSSGQECFLSWVQGKVRSFFDFVALNFVIHHTTDHSQFSDSVSKTVFPACSNYAH